MQSSSSIAAFAPIVFLALGIGAVNWIDLARGQKRRSVAYPVSLVFTLVLAANLFSDLVNDAFNPKNRQERAA